MGVYDFEFVKMASTEDVKMQELNSIFKDLGEERIAEFGELVEFISSEMSQFISNTFGENRFTAALYGSARENVQSYKGIKIEYGTDFDVVIFPTPDDLTIRDEQMEYLPENPMHVRIKGIDFPVLQSYLAEGTEYVATSTLKDFHPDIYGTLRRLLSSLLWIAPKLIEETNSVLRDPFPFTVHQKNNPASPALTIKWCANPCSFVSEPLEHLKWLEVVQDKVQSERSVGSHGDQLQFLETSCYSLVEKMFEIGLGEDDDEKSPANENGGQAGNESEPKIEQLILAETLYGLTGKDQHGNETDSHKENKMKELDTTSKQMKPFEMRKKMNYFDILETFLGTATKTKSPKVTESGKEELWQSEPFGIDFVPAFRSRGWPEVAKEWTKRERKWPSTDKVENIIQEGFHLVVKPPKKGGNPDVDFRISFAHAEYLLSKEMNNIQRDCYRCLKLFHAVYLSKEPKGLASFHLKNLFLKTIEETGTEMWTESNRAKCMIMVLKKLSTALKEKDLRHFFVRSYNLFCDDYIDSQEILKPLAKKVEQIIENPTKFAKELVQKQLDYERGGCRIFADRFFCAMGLFMKQFQENGIEIFANCRGYHDLKKQFEATYEDLTEMAFNDADCRIEHCSPMERSLVKEMRNSDIRTEYSLEQMFQVIYLKVALSTEPDIRCRMLDGIKNIHEWLKVFKVFDEELETRDSLGLFKQLITAESFLDATMQLLPSSSGPELIRSPDSWPTQS